MRVESISACRYRLYLNFQGVSVSILADAEEILSSLRKDFSYFVAEEELAKADVRLVCRIGRFTDGELPKLSSKNIRARSVVVNEKGIRWVSYYDRKAIVRWDPHSEQAEMRSTDSALLYELAYLFILSRSGEILDRRGIHRLHASAVAGGGKAALLVMPSGGGKTTLCMGALELPGLEFLSDDMPLIDRHGNVFAFPSRLGVVQKPVKLREQDFLRLVNRREHGPKWLLDAEIYFERISALAKPGLLVFGRKKLSGACEIRNSGRLSAFRELCSALVLGVGIPQLREYFLRCEFKDVLRKVLLTISRLWTALVLVARSRCFVIELGPDREENIRVYQRFLGAELLGAVEDGEGSDRKMATA